MLAYSELLPLEELEFEEVLEELLTVSESTLDELDELLACCGGGGGGGMAAAISEESSWVERLPSPLVSRALNWLALSPDSFSLIVPLLSESSWLTIEDAVWSLEGGGGGAGCVSKALDCELLSLSAESRLCELVNAALSSSVLIVPSPLVSSADMISLAKSLLAAEELSLVEDVDAVLAVEELLVVDVLLFEFKALSSDRKASQSVELELPLPLTDDTLMARSPSFSFVEWNACLYVEEGSEQ